MAVEYSQLLVRFLEDELRGTFGPPYLTLSRQPDSYTGNEFLVQLVDGRTTARLDNGDEQRVIEIANVGRDDTFYLGFEALFEFAGRKLYILKSMSLTVFHRVAQEIVPMFRAEWDRVHATDETAIHAQPHWHFVQTPERIERIVRSRLGSTSEISEFNSEAQRGTLFSGIADCGSFHFAMSSLWDKGDIPPLKRVFESDDFRKWFLGLTKYIAGQLIFLAGKMPRPDAQVFRPRDKMEGAVE